ncbi:MAG: hypothetical protein IJ094_11640 [Bacilli bacterium]|nr:hypothetical protein [Bacilli bacterium]
MTSKENYVLPLFIGFIIVLVFGGLFLTTFKDMNTSINKKTYLNKIIESNDKTEGKNAYLKVKSISPMFAKGENKKGYYFVSDGDYNYIVLLDKKTAKKLVDSDLESNPVFIEGITKETPNNLKEIALDVYNSGYDDQDKISVKDYSSYFGDIYLEQTLALK